VETTEKVSHAQVFTQAAQFLEGDYRDGKLLQAVACERHGESEPVVGVVRLMLQHQRSRDFTPPAASSRPAEDTAMQNPFLIGDKVYLRPLEEEDAARFVPWMNDPAIWSNLLCYRPLNVRQEQEFIAHVGENDREVILGIVPRDSDQLIGALGLNAIDWKNRHARFGISIGEQTQWGKGYGTEATQLITDYGFDVLNLHRIWLHVYEYNERGQRAYARVGFVREGVLREEHYHAGRYWDVLAMGLLRSDRDARREARV
jgi:RimJ/RimL family protein N-acetyltransferase